MNEPSAKFIEQKEAAKLLGFTPRHLQKLARKWPVFKGQPLLGGKRPYYHREQVPIMEAALAGALDPALALRLWEDRKAAIAKK